MERRKRPYSLYKRSIKNKKIFYSRFRDPVTGKYKSGISTGCTRRDDAIVWSENHLQEAQEAAGEKQNITIEELAQGFWNVNGEYAEGRRARGYSISYGHLENSESYTRNHIIPKWGKDQVKDITTAHIDAWILELYRKAELSPSTINKLLQIMRTLLQNALAHRYRSDNPAEHVKPIKNTHKKRRVLTNDEVKKLFAHEWPDFRHYTINLLAFTTGARLGEVSGLLIKNVYPDRIEILHAWEERHGLKEPKYNSKRAVPISEKVYSCLQRVMYETAPETLVFFSCPERKDIPIGKKCIEKHLYKAMQRIGISEQKRQTRNITFHSWRHKLNSLLRSRGVPDSKIRLLTGHRGSAMTDWYTNYVAEDFTDVVTAQTALIGGDV